MNKLSCTDMLGERQDPQSPLCLARLEGHDGESDFFLSLGTIDKDNSKLCGAVARRSYMEG